MQGVLALALHKVSADDDAPGFVLQVPFHGIDVALGRPGDAAVAAILGGMDGGDQRQVVLVLESRRREVRQPVVGVQNQRRGAVFVQKLRDECVPAFQHGIVEKLNPVDEVISRPRRRDTVEVNAVFDFFFRRPRMLTGDDMDFDAPRHERVREVIDVPGNPADDFGRILPAKHNNAHGLGVSPLRILGEMMLLFLD